MRYFIYWLRLMEQGEMQMVTSKLQKKMGKQKKNWKNVKRQAKF